MATRNEIYNAKTLNELRALAKKYGYKWGWPEKIHQSRQYKRKV